MMASMRPLRAGESLAPGQLDLLNALRDIHAPPPPGLWPPAPGWWLLGLVLLGLIVWLGIRHLQRQRRRRPIHQALTELQAWTERAAGREDDPQTAAELSELLKRAALVHYPRTEVAGLTGEAWLEFLDRTAATEEFRHGPGRVLGNDRYARRVTVEPDAMADLARRWLHAHLDGAGHA